MEGWEGEEEKLFLSLLALLLKSVSRLFWAHRNNYSSIFGPEAMI
jgi:hypothetical protein